MGKIKVGIITQNDPFFLYETFEYLFNNFNNKIYKIVFVIISKSSVSGKPKSFLKKIFETYRIFGIRFFAYYSFQYIKNIIKKKSNIKNLFYKKGVDILSLSKSINHKESIAQISKYEPDIILSILGNQIFKKNLISVPQYGVLNLHTSLLPSYRGLLPTFWALLNDEEYTGVTVHLIDEGIDTGEIICQQKIKINNKTQRQLIKETKIIGMDCIIEAMDIVSQKKEKRLLAEKFSESYFGFPTRKDVKEFINKGKRFF